MPRISSSLPQEPLSWPQLYLGVAFTTLATLLLELSLTRIFSVVFYYHFAFLAISIALFGLGAGGVFSYVVASWRAPLFQKLGTLAAINSVLVVLSLAFVLSRSGELSSVTLALIYFASALPFFLAGAIVSLAISETVERVDRVYFYDLLGAAAGCLILIPLLNAVGGPNTVVAVGVLFAVSSAVWFYIARSARGRVVSVGVALLLTACLILNLKYRFLDVRFAKGQTLQNEKFVKWNSFSRIAVVPEGDTGRLLIVIDGDASTGIARFNFDQLTPEQRKMLLSEGSGFPYVMRPGAKALIIGPGGGWDVSRALASGSKDVTGVEINPIIAQTIMQDRLPELSNRLYHRPEVKIVVEDGRSFVRRTEQRFQVIQATLVDTWASTAAGAFALSENNLYTTDAFYDYLSHLTDDGILAFTRWGFEQPRESLRLLSLARDALARLGQTEPSRHVMVFRQGGQEQLRGFGALDTVLISRRPFTEADVARARAEAPQSGLQILYVPGEQPRNPFGEYLTSPHPKQYEEQYAYDISPVDDNRPFFFYNVQPRDLWHFVTSAAQPSADYKINRAVPLLFSLVGISLVATIVILALPPLVLGSRLPREQGVLRFLLYFVCIGVGYILIQVSLIQKFVLFLGHPTYALTVIIFAMLVASGLGSFYSRRLVAGSDHRLSLILGSVTVLVAILAVVAPVVTTAGVGLPLWMKFVITALLIAAPAFAMGVPFPIGLSRLEAVHKPSVRWAWSLNAASSVLGSASAIFLAIYLGLRETLLVGGLLYLGALLIVRWTRGKTVTV